MPQRISPSKLAAEFLVIFASVVLALLADDWRADRLLLAEQRSALESMLGDLEEDQVDLERLAGRLNDFEQGAIPAMQGMSGDEDLDEEVWLEDFARARRHFLYRPIYPTYLGLRQSGRLNLIRDQALREWIIEYHEDLIGYLTELHQSYATQHDQLMDSLTPHFAAVFDEERGRWTSQLVGTSEALRSDQEVRARLGLYATSVTWLQQRINELFIPHNLRLREAIQASLDGKPLPARIPRK